MPCEASRICNPLAGAPLTDIFGKLTSRAINPIKYLGLLAGAGCTGGSVGHPVSTSFLRRAKRNATKQDVHKLLDRGNVALVSGVFLG